MLTSLVYPPSPAYIQTYRLGYIFIPPPPPKKTNILKYLSLSNSNKDQSLPPYTHTHTHASMHTPRCKTQNTKKKNPSRAKQSSLRDSFLQQSRSQGSSLLLPPPLPRSTIRVIYNTSNLPVVACPLFILPIFFFLLLPSFFSSFPSFPSTLFAPYARKIQEPPPLRRGRRGRWRRVGAGKNRKGWLAGWLVAGLAWPRLVWSGLVWLAWPGWQVTRETRVETRRASPLSTVCIR